MPVREVGRIVNIYSIQTELSDTHVVVKDEMKKSGDIGYLKRKNLGLDVEVVVVPKCTVCLKETSSLLRLEKCSHAANVCMECMIVEGEFCVVNEKRIACPCCMELSQYTLSSNHCVMADFVDGDERKIQFLKRRPNNNVI
jgi:hypothetical protein